jgi:septal ring factor EnvC (AmiA/AmiB activator)
MFISLIGVDGSETLLYTGKWMASSDYSAILRANDAAKNALLNDPYETIATLNKSIADLTTENESLKSKIISSKKIRYSRVDETPKSINPMAGFRNVT